MLNYQEFIAIDTGALDQEWADAASRYMEVVEAKVDADAAVDAAKDKLDTTMASVSNAIRENPDMYGVEKVTDASVKDAASDSPTVATARDELRDAKRQQGLVSGLLTAMDHRRRALENLVELHGRNYQAEPRIKTAAGAEGARKLLSRTTHDTIGQHLNSRGAKEKV